MTLPADSVLPTILDGLIEGVAVFGLDCGVTYWNPAATRITGFDADEVLGRRCSADVFVHLDWDGKRMCGGNGCALQASLRERASVDIQAFIRHKQGHRVPVRVRSMPLMDRAGGVTSVLQVFLEIETPDSVTSRMRALERLSYVDPLTELANRRYAEIVLRTRFEELQRYGWSFGVILLDIDNLKRVNDAFGHEAGDVLLVTVARTLGAGSRPFDLKGRWGGDEFIAVVANVDLPGLTHAAQRLRTLIEQSAVPYGRQVLGTTVSIGAALARPNETPQELVRRADEALYASKHGGKNRISIASQPP